MLRPRLSFLPLVPLCTVVLATSAHANDDFRNCLDTLRGQSAQHNVAPHTFDTHTQGLEPDTDVLALLNHQPEFSTPVWDYMAGMVDDERVADGRAGLAEWRDTLARIEAEYKVEPEVVVAIWGVESNYGQTFGRRHVVRSLATLACEGRRQDFFRGEFFTTLRILEEGHIEADALVGSWAGAFGHTQFMPSTFRRIAVDFDGDGRADLMGSVPDALASTANYLRHSNWRHGEPWGHEVALPSGFDTSNAGRRNTQPLSVWAQQGVRLVDGSTLPEGNAQAGLLLPAGEEGPAFLVRRNFNALYSYNAAETYALAIAHLADRLRGADTFATPWPTDDPGLSRAERREVQERLIALGYDIGEVDGIIGSATRQAIIAWQTAHGGNAGKAGKADGRAGQRLLRALRDHSGQ